jgi:hypothetical protein
VDFVSLSHTEAQEKLSEATLLITSPGLTTTLEAFQRSVPTFFLPPQNYSQWCILRKLRSIDLAPSSFHWEDVSDCPRLADRLPEPVRNPRLKEAINRLTQDTAAKEQFARLLAAVVHVDGAELAARQRRFFESLGPCSTATIAREIAELLSRGITHQPTASEMISA